eukprot:COSAG02_NODE_6264_length_3694_cov_140.769402_2_plen_841_part_00
MTAQTEECMDCPAGLYSEPGQSECTRCDSEFIANLPTTGATRCIRCLAGSAPNAAQTECSLCRPNLYNASLGWVECVDGDSGFDERDWKARQVRAMLEPCRACPPCAQCSNGVAKLRTGFRELPSYAIVLSAGVRVAFRCSRHSGEHPVCNQTASSTCANGREGLFCQSCQRGFHTIHGQCLQCERATLFTTPLAIVSLLAVAVYAWYKLSGQDSHVEAESGSGLHVGNRSPTENPLGDALVEVSDQGAKHAVRGHQQFISGFGIVLRAAFQPLRMVVTWAQITSQIGSVLHLHYPPVFAGAVDALRFLQDVFSVFLDVECAGLAGFESQWLVKVIAIPCMCATILVCTYTVQRKLHGSLTALHNAKSYFLGAIFLIYPSVCNVVFAAYQCRELVVGAPTMSGVLEADDRLLCSSPSMERLRFLSMIVIVVFCVGVPVVSGGGLLYMARGYARLDSDHNAAVVTRLSADFDVDENVADYVLRDVTAMGQSLSFLMDAYTFRCYYWEALDLLRKLLLVGVCLLVSRGSVAQNVVALLLSFSFFALQTTTKPYKLLHDNALRAATELQVFLTIAVGLALHSDLSNEQIGVLWYDWGLFVSFLVLVPCSFCVTVALKVRSARNLLTEDSLEASFHRTRFGFASNADRLALSGHIAAIKKASANDHRRVVVSSPEMATLKPDGEGPYDQFAMDECRDLQNKGVLKIAFDRAGSTTAREEDEELFTSLQAASDPTVYAQIVKKTYWFYGYATAVKRCILLELQGFKGRLELVCIKGGPVTQVEAQEMQFLVEDAKKDAELNQIVVECQIDITYTSYHDFVKEMTAASHAVELAPTTSTLDQSDCH